MNQLGERQILSLLLELTSLLLCARLLGELMKRLGQAPVTGELLAGVFLGPTFFGHLAPGLWHLIFAYSAAVDEIMQAIAWLGAIVLLLQVGFESDVEVLKEVGYSAFLVSIGGIGLPFLCGFALGWVLPDRYLVIHGKRLIFCLFLAVAMAISAIPVIAKILTDLNLVQRKLGMVILGAGTLDDFIGWLVLSVVVGLASHARLDLPALFLTVGASFAFILFCYFIGYRIVGALIRWISDRATLEHSTLSAAILVGLVCAIITQAIGLHAVFGAFVGGLMLSSSSRLRRTDRLQLRGVATGFLSPLFFAYSGLKADLLSLHSIAAVMVVFFVACLSKVLGCALGGLAAGLSARESLAAAFGMNARGGMGVIVAQLGLRLGVLTPETYTILILVALGTSLMSPPLLNWLLLGMELLPEEVERQEREKLLARLPFSNAGAKFLVLAGGGPNAELAVRLAAASSNHHEASLTIFRAFELTKTRERFSYVDDQLEQLKVVAESLGASTVYCRSVAVPKGGILDAVIQESQRGYGAVFAGASETYGHGSLGGVMLRELISSATTPLIITRGAGGTALPRRFLVPVTGTSYSRLALALAILCANSMKAELTALYVAEPMTTLFRRNRARRDNPGDAVLEEAKLLGNHFGLDVATLLVEGRNPDSVILRVARNGEFDLLFLGALNRSVEEGIYLGPKVERILNRAKCSVAVVVMPERFEES